ncbi:hypothetical protein [Brevundimonas sp.]|uniref:hypothetical protein n=1 Tax=Brevundimonas sp. TaxID=1871086 RepID=UPI0025C5DB9B|nr:hypothetical protein [Brevundimonas sp.]MCG2665263.1 hypothetical protein [Brevundimonas sp.]
MLLYQAWLNWRLQRALSGLIPVSVTDQVGDGGIALGAMLVLASGAALAALSGWAVAAFLAGWTIQALYLLWNDRAVRIAEPTALSGRRRSVHAFAGYTAVTALVLCLPMLGVLG